MPPAPSKPAKEYDRPAYMVTLGLLPPYTAEDVERAYLAKIKDIRPDLGGDREAFYDVQNAYMQAKEYVKFRGDRRGWIARRMDEYLEVQEVIDRLKKFGAVVETSSVDWLAKSFGDFAELSESVVGIRLNGAANGDEVLDYLVSQRDKLLELRKLDLAGSVISDAAVRQLSVFRRLAELNLSRTPITWQSLHIVEWLPELDMVEVEGTGLKWLTRRKLAAQLRRKRKATAALRAIHPTSVR
ncbi:MAG: hypothetical protein L0228_19410 [Planctomycetes bacterium]|nr:hypothetical protein [Planctomycetota bacterium]